MSRIALPCMGPQEALDGMTIDCHSACYEGFLDSRHCPGRCFGVKRRLKRLRYIYWKNFISKFNGAPPRKEHRTGLRVLTLWDAIMTSTTYAGQTLWLVYYY